MTTLEEAAIGMTVLGMLGFGLWVLWLFSNSFED